MKEPFGFPGTRRRGEGSEQLSKESSFHNCKTGKIEQHVCGYAGSSLELFTDVYAHVTTLCKLGNNFQRN